MRQAYDLAISNLNFGICHLYHVFTSRSVAGSFYQQMQVTRNLPLVSFLLTFTGDDCRCSPQKLSGDFEVEMI